MKLLPSSILALAFGGLVLGVSAQPADGGGMGPPGTPHGEHGAGMDLRMGMPSGMVLSAAQEQKAFALRHAAEPEMFEQMMALRKAQQTLRQLAESGQFDEAKAAAAAGAVGKASAALALGQARMAAQMQALLTPEQRAKAAEHHPMPRR
jgi:protein CpxP